MLLEGEPSDFVPIRRKWNGDKEAGRLRLDDDKRTTRCCQYRFRPYDRIVQFRPACENEKKWEIIAVCTQCVTVRPSVETIDDDGHKVTAMTIVFVDNRRRFDFPNCVLG